MSRIDERADGVESRIDRLDGRQIIVDGRFDTIDERLDDIEGRVTSRIEVIDSRLCALDGRAEKTAERLESVDERVDRLPVTLNLGDVHKNVGALIDVQTDGQGRRFDSLEQHVAQTEAALVPLADMLRAQPDRAQLAEALGAIVEPVRSDLTRRLGALEETMLALAEALLRPARADKD